MHAFMVHREGDTVGIAIRQIEPGEPVEGVVLGSGAHQRVIAAGSIELGHKIALRPVLMGAEVIEYGVPIGEATADIAVGGHVHVHNLRSIRWRDSVANETVSTSR